MQDIQMKAKQQLQQPSDQLFNDENDQIECQFDVYVNPPQQQSPVFLVQYPMRPSYRPFGDGSDCKQLTSLNYRSQSKQLQMSYKIKTQSSNFDLSYLSEYNKYHKLSSILVQSQSNDCLAKFQDNKLVLVPISNVFQMRTNLDHVDLDMKSRIIKPQGDKDLGKKGKVQSGQNQAEDDDEQEWQKYQVQKENYGEDLIQIWKIQEKQDDNDEILNKNDISRVKDQYMKQLCKDAI